MLYCCQVTTRLYRCSWQAWWRLIRRRRRARELTAVLAAHRFRCRTATPLARWRHVAVSTARVQLRTFIGIACEQADFDCHCANVAHGPHELACAMAPNTDQQPPYYGAVCDRYIIVTAVACVSTAGPMVSICITNTLCDESWCCLSLKAMRISTW